MSKIKKTPNIQPENSSFVHFRKICIPKTVVGKVLDRSFITLEALQTLIVEIEAVLNDRPVTLFLPELFKTTKTTIIKTIKICMTYV